MVALAYGPGAGTVPIVIDWVQRSQAAADALRVDFRFVELSLDPAAWDRQIGALATSPGIALTMMESAFLLQQRAVLAEVTLKHLLPSVYAFQEHVQAGGLFSYGVTNRYITERIAYYVSRILRGEEPGACRSSSRRGTNSRSTARRYLHLVCRSHVRSWSAPTC